MNAEMPVTNAPARPDRMETLESLVGDWRRVMSQSMDGTEKLIKQRPWIALAVAFVVGVVFSEILHLVFGRRR